jgi:hypothetical protein
MPIRVRPDESSKGLSTLTTAVIGSPRPNALLPCRRVRFREGEGAERRGERQFREEFLITVVADGRTLPFPLQEEHVSVHLLEACQK